ncbi:MULTISPECIES: dTDP-4-dehydrorhamnose 3,5-epimerase [Kosakonia]|jgi:dTDP-4-dehydrorhamnose 3,5-epimerase|uniref:dTDP-4-dehydrorhamnose 3,5-epimerase n=1 Tax=Kosakonia TaxID=1330547 RepID=UPI0005B28350|nr:MULTISPECIES: dTDP-4-dehydrorhamnose 3,5-epimerase [Kosakonia]AST69932.1 dTDP-4-dehydrorhamnose 3,5-epimerase [Kosakonia cowanii]AZI87021.1 dTDP-4-dehydrorhamnose 3,5-epimerase [Kosakonia sp. CCTCC M2018092]MDT3412774.1 dTDP-4-dehydrorhamnose 3,5-epimerase [Atlantibacter sp. SORGH_AS_0304]
MNIIDTAINDVKLIEPNVFGDSRGFFMETWNEKKFEQAIGKTQFVQDNHSKSCKGTLRGLHYQLANTQGKLVRVVAGTVYDVVVDLRKHSSTFGKWAGFYLSDENKRQLWVPEGLAHGFYVTSETAEFVYKCTDFYNPTAEQTLLWSDPQLAIEWPLEGEPLLSDKDKQGLLFIDAPKFDY